MKLFQFWLIIYWKNDKITPKSKKKLAQIWKYFCRIQVKIIKHSKKKKNSKQLLPTFVCQILGRCGGHFSYLNMTALSNLFEIVTFVV